MTTDVQHGLFLLRLADCEHADGLARAVRQDDSTADLLVCMTAVNAQLYVDFNGFVELYLSLRCALFHRFYNRTIVTVFHRDGEADFF